MTKKINFKIYSNSKFILLIFLLLLISIVFVESRLDYNLVTDLGGDTSSYEEDDNPYACSSPCGTGRHCEYGTCVDNRPTFGDPVRVDSDGTRTPIDLSDPKSPCDSDYVYDSSRGVCYKCPYATYYKDGFCEYTTASCVDDKLWCDNGCFTITEIEDTKCGPDGSAYYCVGSTYKYDPETDSCVNIYSCNPPCPSGKYCEYGSCVDSRTTPAICADGRVYDPSLGKCVDMITESYIADSSTGSNPSVDLIFTSYVTNSDCSQTFCSGDNQFPYHTHTIDSRKFNGLCTNPSMILTELDSSMINCGKYECGNCLGSADKRCADHSHNMCGLTVDYYSRKCNEVGGCSGNAEMRDHNHVVSGIFEGDDSEVCCQGCGKNWINGVCCGDDSSEIISYRKVASNSNLDGIPSNSNDGACCSNVDNCVFNNVCYSPQTSPIDVDGDEDLDYCNSNGEWQDIPHTCDGTNNFCLCSIGKIGLCQLSGSHYYCYCDFEGIYSKDPYKPIISFLRPPTPNSTFDEYVQKQQSKIKIEIIEPSLTFFQLNFLNQETENLIIFSYPYLNKIYSSSFEGESDLGNYYTLDASFSVDGKYGKALSFDGTDTFTINNFYNPSHEFPLLLGSKKENNFNQYATYTAWVKPTKLDSVNRNIFTDKNNNEGYIRMYNDKIESSFGDEKNKIVYEHNFEEDKWYHVAMTHNYNQVNGLYELKLYLNGELIETSTSSSTSVDYGPDDKLIIGKNFVGLIDEVQIFNDNLNDNAIKLIYASNIERESQKTEITFDLTSFNMTEVVEQYSYSVFSEDFSSNQKWSNPQGITLFDVENNHGNFEIKDGKIEVSDKDIKIQYLVKNIGDNDFFPSIFLPPELDDFYVQKQLDYIGEGKELWINLTLSTKYSNLGEFSKGYDVYNYTEYSSDGSLIKLYKLRDYNTALFRDTLNKKDLILNYDFNIEISSGDRNKTQEINVDINYFCSGEKFILDLVKDGNIYYCLCEDKGFCLNDRPCACIVYPERFVDSTKDEDGNLPKIPFNALYSFDPRTYDKTGEELYYKWYIMGLQDVNLDSLKIKEGTSDQGGANFNLTIRQEGDYYTTVNVSSNEKEDTDFVNFLFSPKDLPYCQRDGSKWIIGGGEIQIINSLDNCYMENGYNKKVCCPAGYKCDEGSCVASLDYNDCGDYITKETCEADDYNVGLKSVEEINGEYFCSSIQFLDEGNQIYVHDCKCSWDEEQGNCGTKYNQTGYNPGGTINYQITGSCEMKVSNIIGNCDTDDFKVYNMKAVWESESPKIPSYCKDQTKKIECGNLVLLNFFDTTQVILTILIIILVYLIIFRIKKKN